jgi:hypothetical protein
MIENLYALTVIRRKATSEGNSLKFGRMTGPEKAVGTVRKEVR